MFEIYIIGLPKKMYGLNKDSMQDRSLHTEP